MLIFGAVGLQIRRNTVRPDLQSGRSEYKHLQCETLKQGALQMLISGAVGLQIRRNGKGALQMLIFGEAFTNHLRVIHVYPRASQTNK